MPMKLMVRVRPGVELTCASFWPSRELIKLDFPTFERPRNANSGGPSGGNPLGLAADVRNLAMMGFDNRFLLLLLRTNRLPLFIGQHVAEGVERSCSFEQRAAVHDDEFAVDVSGMIAHQKCGEVREFFVGPKASDRTVLAGLLFQFLHRKQTRKR